MTFLIQTCDHCGRRLQAVATRRRSRPALASESAGALTGAAPALTEAVVKIPGGLSPDGAVRVVSARSVANVAASVGNVPAAPMTGPSLRGPARAYSGPRVSPLRSRRRVAPLLPGG